jgi:CheY-like chemotaxis protein
VELVVADTGVGMARHRQAEAFEEFVQLHEGRGPEQGLGLGLAIVRRLVGLLGLRLALRSRPGRGTVFSLHLPQADQPMAPGSGALAAMPQATDALGLRPGDVVIVIDDNVAIQLAMRALLSGWGCVAHVAANPADLMPQLMDLQAVPALLLCDGEGGIDAIAEIREAFNLDVPAILISGDTGPGRLREAVASGLPLLHKPVTQARLREAIVQVMAQRSGPQPGRLPPLAGGAPRSGS